MTELASPNTMASASANHEAATHASDDTGSHRQNVVAGELPPEIRNEVYKLVRSESAPLRGLFPSDYTSPPRGHDLDLLLVSRQTYLEALPFFYRLNKLYFRTNQYMYLFLKGIGETRRQELTQVALVWERGSFKVKPALTLLKTCSNLKSIIIVVEDFIDKSYTFKHWWGKAALMEIRGMETVIFRSLKTKAEVDGPVIQQIKTAMMRPRL